jgi:uncharacterized protein (DUF2141 family)
MCKFIPFSGRQIFFMAAIIFFSPSVICQVPGVKLQIQFTQVTVAKGSIMLGIYDRESAFMDPKQARLLKILPVTQTGSLELELSGLPEGSCAISAYHDVNGNGQLDKNLLGIPTEPYVFSNQARPKFRAPRWEEAKMELGKNGSRVVLKLEKW